MGDERVPARRADVAPLDVGLTVPALSKSPEDRTGHHGAPVELARTWPPVAPVPRPPGLSVKLRKQWDGLWVSPVAQLLDPATDAPIIARLFELYGLDDNLATMLARDGRAERAAQKRLRTAVAEADPVALEAASIEIEAIRRSYNSTVASRVRVATEVRMLEAQLGLSPRSRLALGVMLLAGRRAMAEATAGDDDDDDY